MSLAQEAVPQTSFYCRLGVAVTDTIEMKFTSSHEVAPSSAGNPAGTNRPYCLGYIPRDCVATSNGALTGVPIQLIYNVGYQSVPAHFRHGVQPYCVDEQIKETVVQNTPGGGYIPEYNRTRCVIPFDHGSGAQEGSAVTGSVIHCALREHYLETSSPIDAIVAEPLRDQDACDLYGGRYFNQSEFDSQQDRNFCCGDSGSDHGTVFRNKRTDTDTLCTYNLDSSSWQLTSAEIPDVNRLSSLSGALFQTYYQQLDNGFDTSLDLSSYACAEPFVGYNSSNASFHPSVQHCLESLKNNGVPEVTKVEKTPEFGKGFNVPITDGITGQNVIVLQEGFLEIPDDGLWTIRMHSKAAVIVHFNGELVVNTYYDVYSRDGQPPTSARFEFTMDLRKGKYPISIQYLHTDGESYFDMSWKKGDQQAQPFVPIPSSAFSIGYSNTEVPLFADGGLYLACSQKYASRRSLVVNNAEASYLRDANYVCARVGSSPLQTCTLAKPQFSSFLSLRTIQDYPRQSLCASLGANCSVLNLQGTSPRVDAFCFEEEQKLLTCKLQDTDHPDSLAIGESLFPSINVSGLCAPDASFPCPISYSQSTGNKTFSFSLAPQENISFLDILGYVKEPDYLNNISLSFTAEGENSTTQYDSLSDSRILYSLVPDTTYSNTSYAVRLRVPIRAQEGKLVFTRDYWNSTHAFDFYIAEMFSFGSNAYCTASGAFQDDLDNDGGACTQYVGPDSWTGTQCCGDDLTNGFKQNEFYVDTDGICFNSRVYKDVSMIEEHALTASYVDSQYVLARPQSVTAGNFFIDDIGGDEVELIACGAYPQAVLNNISATGNGQFLFSSAAACSIENGYYCSFHGWQDDSYTSYNVTQVNDSLTTQATERVDQRFIEDNATVAYAAFSCCGAGHCADPQTGQCVAPSLLLDSLTKSNLCVNGEFVQAQLKPDWYGEEYGYCPSNSCFLDDVPAGVRLLSDDQNLSQCKPNNWVSRRNFIPNLVKASDWEDTGDLVCVDGRFQSRTSYVAAAMLSLVSAPDDDYVLSCGDPKYLLENNAYQPGSSNLALEEFTNLAHRDVFNNICLLSYDDGLVVGASLNDYVEALDASINASIAFKQAFDLDADLPCTGQSQIPSFNACAGTDTLYYNDNLDIFVYAFEHSPAGGGPLFDRFYDVLIAPVISFLSPDYNATGGQGSQPTDYVFLQNASQFSFLYLNEHNNKSIRALIEPQCDDCFETILNQSQIPLQSTIKSYLSVVYTNISVDICSSVRQYNQRHGNGAASCQTDNASNTQVVLGIQDVPPNYGEGNQNAAALPDDFIRDLLFGVRLE